MRIRDDRGFTLTELLVVLALMGFVIGAAYMALDFTYRAQAVAETQSDFARSVAGPLNVMDTAFSQNTLLTGTTPFDPYFATIRLPADYAGIAQERTYTAGSDGTLVERVYQVSGTNKTLLRTAVWATTNSNRQLAKPMFLYFRGSVPATNAATADNVVIDVWTVREGRQFHDTRRVHFRNR